MDLQRMRWWLKLQKMRFEVWRAKNPWFETAQRFFRRLFRFGFTVFCAALLATWAKPQLATLSHGLHGFFETSWELAETVFEAISEHSDSLISTGSFAPWPFGSKITKKSNYQLRLENTMSRLRRIQYYRMVRVELPAEVLKYQQGRDVRVGARTANASFIAVSKDLKTYLEEKDISYIEAHRIPDRLIAGSSLPLKRKTFQQTLLIPDVTGSYAKSFSLN